MLLEVILAIAAQVQPGQVVVLNPDEVWSRQGSPLTTDADQNTGSASGTGWAWSWDKNVKCTIGHVHTNAHDHTESMGIKTSVEGVKTGIETWKYNGDNVKGTIDEQLVKRIDGLTTFSLSGSGGAPQAQGALYAMVKWGSTTQDPPSVLEINKNEGTVDSGPWNSWLSSALQALDPPIDLPNHVTQNWGQNVYSAEVNQNADGEDETYTFEPTIRGHAASGADGNSTATVDSESKLNSYAKIAGSITLGDTEDEPE